MNIILDSCSIINLINGEVFDKIFSLKNYCFYLGLIVQEECYKEPEQIPIIDLAISSKKLLLIEEDIELSKYKEYKKKYNLGDGETESIISAKDHNMTIASDDNMARKSAIIEIGEENVVGTIYLLREMVRQNLIQCDESIESLLIMKIRGGFLPLIGTDYLCN